ncbi:MAG: RES domain-containing protein [Bacteroidetes bacterium]|nr:RES domain-containing protein [Bacteroidota bacterium]
MLLYRFSKLEYINDISGNGAKLYGGRWNSKGQPMLYTSESVSLALIELLCNSGNGFSLNKTGFVILDIPTRNTIIELQKNELPSNWQAYPSPETLKKIGDVWLQNKNSLALKVPSAVVDVEYNVLLNPLHKDFNKVKVIGVKPYQIDKRLLD